MRTLPLYALGSMALALALVHCGGDDTTTCGQDCTSSGGTSASGGSGSTSSGGGGGDTNSSGGSGGGLGGFGGGGSGGGEAAALDPTFGDNGVVTTLMREASDEIVDVAKQSDGKIVAVGVNRSHSDLLVFRFNADGSPDASFNHVGSAILPTGLETRATAIGVQPDGKLIVVGNDVQGSVVARLMSDGVLDATWGTGGYVRASARAGALAIQPDGRVLLAYEPASFQGPATVRRLTATGADDGSFAAGGAKAWGGVASAIPFALGVDSAGRIVMVGAFNEQAIAIARFTSSGDPDEAFGVGGSVETGLWKDIEQGHPLGIQPDDKLIIGGRNLQATPSTFLARYDETGLLDASFDGDGYAAIGAEGGVEDIEVVGAGDAARIVVLRGGYDDADDTVYRYGLSGAPDAAFGADGRAPGGSRRSHALVVTDAGGLVLGGAERTRPPAYDDSYFKPRLLALTSAGAVDASWADSGKAWAHPRASLDEVRKLATTSDGGVIAVGLSSIDGSYGPGFALAKYSAAGVLDASFGVDGRSYLDATDHRFLARGVAVDSLGRVVVTGGSGSTTARFNADGSLDATFGDQGMATLYGSTTPYAYAMALDASDRILIGGALPTSGKPSFLTRASAEGALDPTFGTDGFVVSAATTAPAFGAVLDLAVQADGKFLATGAGSVGLLTRFTADGAPDPTFKPTDGALGVGRDITLTSDGKIVVVGSTRVDGYIDALDRYLPGGSLVVARFLADGTPDEAFATGGVLSADLLQTGLLSGPMGYAAHATPSGALYVAGTGLYGGAPRGFFARLRSDGTLDPSFGAAGVVLAPMSGAESSLMSLVQTGDRLVAGGYAYLSPTGRDFALAALRL